MIRNRHVQGYTAGYQNDLMVAKGSAYLETSEIMPHTENMLTVINDFHIE
jgi:hypothetical protein